VSRQLAEWGDRRDAGARPRIARLERDLERVLEDLADDFPLLRSLVDRRAGGQKRLPMPGRGDERVPAPLFANVLVGNEPTDQGRAAGAAVVDTPSPHQPSTSTSEPSPPTSGQPRPSDARPEEESEPSARLEGRTHAHAAAMAGTDSVTGRRRPARYGLLVQFESRAGDAELGRLVDSTVWINDAHPAYARALASRSIGYHTALAVALALAPLAVEASQEHSFITQFLAQWGGAQAPGRAARRLR
jgi:hypothetical protein